jgi:FkbM family methyltransferase
VLSTESRRERAVLMTPWRLLNKPYYVFRPTQVIRRLLLSKRDRTEDSEFRDVELPWGLVIRTRRDDQTSVYLGRRGVFDLAVTEVLFRLADAGALTVDVGANVGYMTSILGLRCGPSGRVVAFEPHPLLHAELAANLSSWRLAPGFAQTELRRSAASDRSGIAELIVTPAFQKNVGLATLSPPHNAATAEVIEVPTERLDDVFDEEIAVLKVDVEGHEPAVFRGASRMLEEHLIRTIVFEQTDDPPTPATDLLERFGYTVFSLDHTLFGPVVAKLPRRAAAKSGDDPSYVATVDVENLERRLYPRGWLALGMPLIGRSRHDGRGGASASSR